MNKKTITNIGVIIFLAVALIAPLIVNHYFDRWYSEIKEFNEVAYVNTEIGCLKTIDTKQDFDNRQKLMYDMGLPVYLRCNK